MNLGLLEKTFALVQKDSKQFARSFYQTLFKEYPEVKVLFAEVNIEQQEKKLMDSLALIVESFRNIELLQGIIKKLGKRHLSYQVIAQHYQIVGGVLVATLKKYLGKEWTAEVERVWIDAYHAIVDLMLEGSREEYCSSGADKNSNIKCLMNQMRLKAILEKNLKDLDENEITDRAFIESYFIKEIEEKVGKEKTKKILSEILDKKTV